LIWHPDKVEVSKRDEAEAMFKDIKEAYDVLMDGINSFSNSANIFRGKAKVV
jgi:DnaJ-class molecular chaperone